MAIITTPSSVDANSYLSLSEANSYFLTNKFNATWSLLSDNEKESWIIEATKAIELFRFIGYRTQKGQALSFPRTVQTQASPYGSNNVDDVMGYRLTDPDFVYDSTSIHVRVKSAQAVLIMLLYDAAQTGGVETQDIKKLGLVDQTLVVEFSKNPNSEQLKSISGNTLETVRTLLGPWIRSSLDVTLGW